MKYVVLLCDGMADEPLAELGGLTPMEKAFKPNMDRLAAISEVGLSKTVQDGMKPGSDVANLSVLGYNAKECYTGRSPLEAESIGIDMAETDVSFRCNLVTLSDEPR
jgi:2,3-bisphosphoglycerate-independent phosphoglycerate mutase